MDPLVALTVAFNTVTAAFLAVVFSTLSFAAFYTLAASSMVPLNAFMASPLPFMVAFNTVTAAFLAVVFPTLSFTAAVGRVAPLMASFIMDVLPVVPVAAAFHMLTVAFNVGAVTAVPSITALAGAILFMTALLLCVLPVVPVAAAFHMLTVAFNVGAVFPIALLMIVFTLLMLAALAMGSAVSWGPWGGVLLRAVMRLSVVSVVTRPITFVASWSMWSMGSVVTFLVFFMASLISVVAGLVPLILGDSGARERNIGFPISGGITLARGPSMTAQTGSNCCGARFSFIP